jgi:hypothetical protein
MGVRPFALLLALLPAPPASGKPGVERAGELLFRVDHSIEVPGAGAPDLHPPSAEVARVKAERTARADAGRRLLHGLAALPAKQLGCRDASRLPTVDKAIERAEVASIEWGSDGSVRLTLRVKAADLVAGRSVMAGPHAGIFPLFTGEDCAAAALRAEGDQ